MSRHPTPPQVYNRKGEALPLGALLGEGGEGTVWEVAGQRHLVAKVYHQPLDREQTTKLGVMVHLSNERLLRLAAWPLDILQERPGGPLRGMVMPRAIGKPIHTLYGPKSRLAEFPQADWRFLVHAAGNVARAFGVIQDHGHVIGDVNHGNLLVSDKALVTLIDCDSFQIVAGGHHFLCEVGVETHTPPELQGRPFRDLIRTPNHDNFGLAVLLFQLLFMGRHPFAGYYLGPGEMQIPQAIAEFRFAYGAQARQHQMQPPPGALSLSAVSSELARLFERAFAPESTRPQARPQPREWVEALTRLSQSLRQCDEHTGHYYPTTLSACPWCPLEEKAQVVLFRFIPVGDPLASSDFDLAAFWQGLTNLPTLPPLPPLPDPTQYAVSPSPEAVARRQQFRQGWGAFTSLLGWNSTRKKARWEWQCALEKALQHRQREKEWHTRLSRPRFAEQWKTLENLRQQYLELPTYRQQKLNDLHTTRRERQLQQFLDRYKLALATIPGIGAERKATLQSYGIETAADVVAADLLHIPGFGPVLVNALMGWRQVVESRFRFNPNQEADAIETMKIDRLILAMRRELEKRLKVAAGELRQTAERFNAERRALRQSAQQTAQTIAQLQADLAIL